MISVSVSSVASLLAVAEPWTYWLAPPLLAANLVAVLIVAVGYYHKVVVPRYEWQQHQALLQAPSQPQPVASLDQLRPAPAVERPEAA